jgi:hypothetical protein
MTNYNQLNDKYLKNSCTIHSLLNIMKYMYWIQVNTNFIMKVAIFFDKLWVFFPSWWAVFDTIYRSFVYEMNSKLWLEFKLYTTTLNWLDWDDTRSYWIWIKKYSSSKWKELETDWASKEEVDAIIWNNKGTWHNVVWDWSKGWYLINSDWKPPKKFSLFILKYAVNKWLIWNTWRTIIPADEFTKKVTDITIQMAKNEKRWKLEAMIKRLEDWGNKYIAKAKELYFYGR